MSGAYSFSPHTQTITNISSTLWGLDENVLMLILAYREEFEERVLENLPLFILIGNHWNINFAEILREQEDETDGAETNRNILESPSLSGFFP